MKTNKKNSGIKVTANVRAGAFIHPGNHNRTGLSVRTGVKAGTIYRQNHNRKGLSVRTGVKAGTIYRQNHNRLLALA